MKPIEHARSSIKVFGGKPDDYIDIHELLDSSKAAFGDLRHRALTHNSWFITSILERIFGKVRMNSDNKEYSVRDVGEQHVLEDFRGKFIPSVQDFLCELELKDWMDNGNGDPPPSRKKVSGKPHAQHVPDVDKFNKAMHELNQKQNNKRCGAGLLD